MIKIINKIKKLSLLYLSQLSPASVSTCNCPVQHGPLSPIHNSWFFHTKQLFYFVILTVLFYFLFLVIIDDVSITALLTFVQMVRLPICVWGRVVQCCNKMSSDASR